MEFTEAYILQFHRVAKRYALKRRARPEVADDFASQAVLELIEKDNGFIWQRWSTFMKREARRECEPITDGAEPMAADIPDYRGVIERVRSVIAEPENRAIFLLDALFGFSQREIAALFGFTEGAIKQRMKRARARLKVS